MNLRWNGSMRRWEAEFSDFQADLAAVKAAGFKTDGPPEWIWYAYKAGPLTKLRANRPASGLTISPEAREMYSSISAVEESNAKVKAEAAKIQKEQKKTRKEFEEKTFFQIPEKGYIDASDLPPMPPRPNEYVPPPPPKTKCLNCGDPVYFYEQLEPYPLCLWCEVNGWVI